VLTINDPIILGSYVDKTIFVVSANEVSRQVIKQGIATLRKSHNHLLGVVLNKFRTEGSHYYYYYYYYYHTPEDGGNGFKKFWRSSLALMGIRKRRRRRRRSHRHTIQMGNN
jgi:Mrp family chromosome partitioning ATPase